jgi:hypothetical protein
MTSINGNLPAAAVWISNQQDADDAYKRVDCVWNLASDELQAQGKDGKVDPSAVTTEVNTLINNYNSAVRAHTIHGPQITNPDKVTVSELTAMEKAASGAAPTTASLPATRSNKFGGADIPE